METNVIRVGNSKGIILPSKILKMVGIQEKVSLKITKDSVIIRPLENVRSGWAEAFKATRNEDNELLIDEVFEDDLTDIEW